MGMLYFAAFGDDEKAVGLFRVTEDDESQTLNIERLSSDGSWVSDPTVIDELQEPGVTPIDPEDAQAIEQEILAAAEPDADELSREDVADAAAAEPAAPGTEG